MKSADNLFDKHRELLDDALFDPLTRAMNRRAFEKKYETSILSQTFSCIAFMVMSAKRVGSYFVLMRQWGMVKLSRPKEIHHAPF
jgi:hypothetical protein